ncbi:MAG: hypothetical protein FJ090_17640 [Deltaproteobacteria bacterium]|nr:hypothetical protein [Deltaproteobacteria bacterium]
MVVALALLGCDDPAASGAGGINSTTFLAFDLAAAWTWRDDGDTGLVLDDETLLHGRMDADGRVEVRRGARYALGSVAGLFTWKLDTEDIVLAAWQWGDEGSDTPTVLAVGGSEDGQVASNGEGACTPQRYESLPTSYGEFPDVLACVCVNTAAPDGTYWFAENFGLVKTDTSPFDLDLVAPW